MMKTYNTTHSSYIKNPSINQNYKVQDKYLYPIKPQNKAGDAKSDAKMEMYRFGFVTGVLTTGLLGVVGNWLASKKEKAPVNPISITPQTPISAPRSGVIDKMISTAAEHGILTSLTQGVGYAVPYMIELVIKTLNSKISEPLDAAELFKAKQHIEHARTMFEGHKRGYSSFSPQIKKEFHTTLDRAALLFREAGGNLEGNSLLLLPEYSMYEVATHLLNGKKEVAKYTARRCRDQYKQQTPKYIELKEKVFHASAEEPNAGTKLTGAVLMPWSPILGLVAGLLTDKPVGSAIQTIFQGGYASLFHEDEIRIFRRVRDSYGYSSPFQTVDINCQKLLSLPDKHRIFKQIPNND